jgi:hypothetical protein
MNSLSTTGAVMVTMALVSYSIAISSEQIKRKIIRRVMIFITLGVLLDISATVFMILGSRNSPFTVHGIIGYSALSVMLVEGSLLWSLYRRKGIGTDVPFRLHRYSLMAYIWWVVAYITGSIIAMS